MSTVGIDYGTTNCVVAHFVEGKPEPIRIDTPDDDWAMLGFDQVLPSVFALDEARGPLFGWPAKRRFDLPRADAVKRMLGSEETLTLGAESVLVDEVVALMFGHIKRMAAAESGVDVDQAVVTIPANSKGPVRQRTKICASLAGIEVMTLINEPTAAAMAYGLHAQEEQKILVYDFGGGTLDVTLLQSTEGVFMEHASKGIGKLGGIDFDQKLMGKILETVPDHQGWSEVERGAFRLEVEKAKIHLSTRDETNVILPNGEIRRVTRKMFEEVVRALIEKTRDPIQRCLSDVGMQSGEIDALVMVGGTSKIPAVRAFVSDVVGREPVSGVDAMTAVGEGAAIAAAILAGENPQNDFLVTIEHDLGTRIIDSGARTLRFDPIIARNHKIPAKGSSTYKPVIDNQPRLHVSVIEGDVELPFDHPDQAQIWEDVLDIPEPRPIDEITFEFTYEYDGSGILYVTITDLEKDILILDRLPISPLGVANDKRAMVQLAGRVAETLDGGAMGEAGAHAAQPASGVDDPEARALIEKARTKVLPFLDEEQAAALLTLVDGVSNATNGDMPGAKAALEAELRKYAYLL
jgi:molecular chaperone DnaK (HSP70)